MTITRRVSPFEAIQVRALLTPELRSAIIKHDRGMCRYCAIRPKWKNIEIDHVRPVIYGGLSTLENCVTACRPCNQKKGWSRGWTPIPLDQMPPVPSVDGMDLDDRMRTSSTPAKKKMRQQQKAEKRKARLEERERRFANGELLWDFEVSSRFKKGGKK